MNFANFSGKVAVKPSPILRRFFGNRLGTSFSGVRRWHFHWSRITAAPYR